MMARFGRYSFQPHLSPDTEIYHDVIIPLYPLAQASPDKFVTWLRDQVLPVGGWAVLGASRALWELLGSGFQHPARTELLTAGLQFLRNRGVPNPMVTGYEWRFWCDTKGQNEPWLVGRPKPTPDEAPITDLTPGELRPIIQIFPEPDSNRILVRRQDGGYTSVVDARWSDDDPHRVQRDDKHAATLNDLYWEIGCVFQIPTHWYHPEMAPYFPLPPPRLE
jgi:hypothetical protein